MATDQKIQDYRIDQFYSGPGARADHWRFLVDAANAWSHRSGTRASFDALLVQLEATEEFHAYPGSQLIAALRDGRLGGAALDVFEEEPTPAERWRDVPNTVLTPHVGGVTFRALSKVFDRAAENVADFLAGR